MARSRISTIFSVVIVLILSLNFSSPSASTHAQTSRLSIVGSTTLIADVVGRVAGDAADVTSLMGYGVDPHAYEPSAQDIVTLDEADVVFVNGANFEEGLLSVLAEAAPDNLVTISDCVAILPFGLEMGNTVDNGQAAPTANDSSAIAQQCASHFDALTSLGVEINHSDEPEAAVEPLGLLYETNCAVGGDHPAEGDEDHEIGSCDPHLWTDVHNVMLWTLMARDVLSEADPANAATYSTNTDAYLAELIALDTEVAHLLASVPEQNRVLITNHETLGYLAARYGYQIVGSVIPGGGTSNEPSAEDVASLIETVQDYGVSAIFSENTVSASLAQEISDETGAGIYQLYSDSLTDTDGPAHTYIDYMRTNATTIVTALNPQ
ncbi:MAG: zinc ABC transporter substrate-binding protein [Chloroflexi bacterium]|nr:zinc ABC transporter substrate-binding protein [Chloroflexota bacterium]